MCSFFILLRDELDIVPCDRVPDKPLLMQWYESSMFYPPLIANPIRCQEWADKEGIQLKQANIDTWYEQPGEWAIQHSSLYWCPVKGPMLFRYMPECRTCFPHNSHPAVPHHHAWDVKADKNQQTNTYQAG